MTSTDFDTEYGYDIVTLFDGDSVSSTEITQYSGNLVDVKAQSMSPILTVRFTSDYSVGTTGFSFRVETTPSGTHILNHKKSLYSPYTNIICI